MALATHASLLQRGCRLLTYSSVGKLCRATLKKFSGGLVVAEWQSGERAASSRAEGRRSGGSGGRREGFSPQQSSSIWGDEWGVGNGQAGNQSSGWLAVKESSNSEERPRNERSSSGGGWQDRGDGRSGGHDRPERDGGSGRGGQDWPGREGGWSGGGVREGGRFGGGREGERERRGYGGRGGERGQGRFGGGREGERERRGYGGRGGERGQGRFGGGREGERERRGYGGRGGVQEGGHFGGGREGAGWEPRAYQPPNGGGASWEGSSVHHWGNRGAGSERQAGWPSDRGSKAQVEGDEAVGGGDLRQFWLGDVLYGVSPVLAALQAGRRTVHTLYLQDGMDLSKRKDKGAVQAAKQRAEELGAVVRYASKHDLNMLADNRPHQGVVLDCSPLEFEPMSKLPDAPSGGGGAAAGRLPVWLCLDEVMDPQNFGAALRSAYYLGVSGVLTCHRNSAPLSAVVSKASAGAMELLPVYACKSLPQTLADAKERGWQVLGAAAEAGATGAASFVLDRPAVLVMGNEGYGLRTTVRRLCDAMLQIDDGVKGRHSMVDSLNVSVASGILLHRLLTAQVPTASGGMAAAAPPVKRVAAAKPAWRPVLPSLEPEPINQAQY